MLAVMGRLKTGTNTQILPLLATAGLTGFEMKPFFDCNEPGLGDYIPNSMPTTQEDDLLEAYLDDAEFCDNGHNGYVLPDEQADNYDPYTDDEVPSTDDFDGGGIYYDSDVLESRGAGHGDPDHAAVVLADLILREHAELGMGIMVCEPQLKYVTGVYPVLKKVLGEDLGFVKVECFDGFAFVTIEFSPNCHAWLLRPFIEK